MTDDLNIIEPEGVKVQFAGQEVVVKPLVVEQIPAISRALKGISISADDDIMDLVINTMADSGENLIEAVIIATGIPAETVRKAPVDDFVNLAMTVFEVNADFFVKRLAPMIKTSIDRVRAQMNGAGLTQFKA